MAKQLNARGPRKSGGIDIRNAQWRRLHRALERTEISSLPETSGVRRTAEALLRAGIAQLDRGRSIDKTPLHDTVWRDLKDVTADDWDKGLELARELSEHVI